MSKKWTWRGKNPSSSGLVSVSCYLSVKRLQHDGSSQACLQRMFIFLTAPQAIKREPSSLRARMVEVLSSIAGVLLSPLNPNSVPEKHFIISFARVFTSIYFFVCMLCGRGACVPQHTRGGQRTTRGGHFSSSVDSGD